jgi:hypothetical protein
MIDISNYIFTDSKDKFQDKNDRFYLIYGEDYNNPYLLIFNEKQEHIGSANLGKYSNNISIIEDISRITKISYDELEEDTLFVDFVKYIAVVGGGYIS